MIHQHYHPIQCHYYHQFFEKAERDEEQYRDEFGILASVD